MQRYQKSMSGLALGLALTMAACGGDPLGVNSGDELSDTEIQAIFNAFSGALDGVDASASRVAPQDGIQMADIDVNQSVNISTGCNLGGEISLSGSVEGTVDDETFASNLEMGIGIQFDACIIASEENTVSVDGDVQFDSHIVIDEGAFSVDGSQVGGFDFTTNDGRIGSCAIDIDFSASLSEGTSAQSSVTGTVCGRSASQFEAYTGT
jgi:hypothetical protein